MGIKLLEKNVPKGYVYWELIDNATGRVTKRGKGVVPRNFRERLYDLIPSRLHSFFLKYLPLGYQNAILNFMRNKMADFFIGTSVTPPTFIGIATGTGSVGAADTTLDTPVDYDGANEAKAVDSKTLLGLYTSRLVVAFSTTEANQTIGQVGLFDAANSGNLWAKVKVSITKTSTERLNIYWYITWERRAGLAIKTGASIGVTGTATQNTISTLTFASAVTVFMIHNNSGSLFYVKFNAALDHATLPTNYDLKLADGDRVLLTEEELSVVTLSVTSPAATFALPHNNLAVSGW